MANEKEIKSLEARIVVAMKTIKEGTQTPKESDIAKMLNTLKELDVPAYEKTFELYKPISKKYFDDLRSSPEYLKKVAAEKKAADAAALAVRSSGFSDEDVTSGPRSSKESKVKVKKEPKMKMPKAVKTLKEKGNRDKKEYVFNGVTYKKGKLVLAIIREHVRLNSKITFDLLKKDFPDELLKGYGIFQTQERAKEVSIKINRFFLKDSEFVELKGGGKKVVISVCNQFSIDNISPVLIQARKLGYKID